MSAALPSNLANTIISENQNDNWVKCPSCGASVRPWHVKEEQCFVCEDLRRQARKTELERIEGERALAEALGGKRALRFTRESFVVSESNREAFDAAVNFQPREQNLYLCGSCGTGKTHLACMIARAAIEAGRKAEYLQPGKLLRRIRAAKSGADEQDEIDRLTSLDVLVLDDLGAEKDTEFAIQVLYEVVDGRVMNEKSGLVVTSNLSLPELAGKLRDDRLPSRLAGMCRVIQITGKDWRVK